MLQIKNISKQYKTGDFVQNALDNVSLNLRDNEFVAILGPSGSGKTTLLNIIGGLDRYDSGDLIINSISTKEYKDRDWDSYRNHTIGFVFQNYNLIPHQTVLSNVELALTISGISKKERHKRAIEALEKVGLKDQIHKKPNQMSGGQMQRVAIARALVNNPHILLADEPTGALDTKTSVQVMELLKEVAKERLVVMVTHNPELAQEYANRIVELKDGHIISDTNPLIIDENSNLEAIHKNLGKSSMSFLTALSLSFNNLLTKKGRTFLTAFAGSIGIIGIALILSLSTGFQNYIDQIQEDTLTSYPLSIYSDTADMTSMMATIASDLQSQEKEPNKVYEAQVMSTSFSEIGTNDLKSFIKYLDENKDEVYQMVTDIDYDYSIQPIIYNYNLNDIEMINPNQLLSMMFSNSAMSLMSSGSGNSVFVEVDDIEVIKENSELIAGRFPEKFNEVILVLPNKDTITDFSLYLLGLRDQAELKEMLTKIASKESFVNTNEALEFTYNELLDIKYYLVNPADKYRYNAQYNIYEDMSDDDNYMKKVLESSEVLEITGIIIPNESDSISLTGGIYYTEDLTKYVIEQASRSEIVQKQLSNRDIDVFSNKSFDDDKEDVGLKFDELITIDEDILKEAFGGELNEDDISKMTESYMGEISKSITTDTTPAKNAFNEAFYNITIDLLKTFISENEVYDDDNNLISPAILKLDEITTITNTYLSSDKANDIMKPLVDKYFVPKDTYLQIFNPFINGLLQSYIVGEDLSATEKPIVETVVEPMVQIFMTQDMINTTANQLAKAMTEAKMQVDILKNVGELMGKTIEKITSAFNVDPDKIAQAFKINVDEEEMMRLMTTMSSNSSEKTAETNLISLGYQDIESPSVISFYFKDFDSKEAFKDYIDSYNQKMTLKGQEDKEIDYADLTGLLMSSVSTIVNAVSYVLISFVAISLVVSSIMIGIITYISVLERTKEIGILRAIGASKRNISSIFNAETFIVGLLSGIIGIATTILLLPPINTIIHNVANTNDINAVLPPVAAIILVILSVTLTLISGLIPSSKAAKKDPVTALRTE